SGVLYTDTVVPINAASNGGGGKKGEASCVSIFGVSLGDCSIDTAAKNAGIRAIKSVDQKRWGVLGVYLKETTIVTGD
ncbi:MAG: TRL-like family protein, partial [Mucispirillum sp.]|nr:TRL-like family protein [Mucispirillum sp.]